MYKQYINFYVIYEMWISILLVFYIYVCECISSRLLNRLKYKLCDQHSCIIDGVILVPVVLLPLAECLQSGISMRSDHRSFLFKRFQREGIVRVKLIYSKLILFFVI